MGFIECQTQQLTPEGMKFTNTSLAVHIVAPGRKFQRPETVVSKDCIFKNYSGFFGGGTRRFTRERDFFFFFE